MLWYMCFLASLSFFTSEILVLTYIDFPVVDVVVVTMVVELDVIVFDVIISVPVVYLVATVRAVVVLVVL